MASRERPATRATASTRPGDGRLRLPCSACGVTPAARASLAREPSTLAAPRKAARACWASSGVRERRAERAPLRLRGGSVACPPGAGWTSLSMGRDLVVRGCDPSRPAGRQSPGGGVSQSVPVIAAPPSTCTAATRSRPAPLGVPIARLGVPIARLGVPIARLGVPIARLGVPTARRRARARVSGCRSRVSGCRWRVSGCRWRVSGCRWRGSGCRWRDSGCRWRVSGCQPRVSGCRSRVSGCRSRVSGCQPRVSGCRSRVSGCRVRVSGCQPRSAGCRWRVSGCRYRCSGCRTRCSGCRSRCSGADRAVDLPERRGGMPERAVGLWGSSFAGVTSHRLSSSSARKMEGPGLDPEHVLRGTQNEAPSENLVEVLRGGSPPSCRETAAGGCPVCDGPLYRGDYDRKPRGGLIAHAGEELVRRPDACAPVRGRRATYAQLPPGASWRGRSPGWRRGWGSRPRPPTRRS